MVHAEIINQNIPCAFAFVSGPSSEPCPAGATRGRARHTLVMVPTQSRQSRQCCPRDHRLPEKCSLVHLYVHPAPVLNGKVWKRNDEKAVVLPV